MCKFESKHIKDANVQPDLFDNDEQHVYHPVCRGNKYIGRIVSCIGLHVIKYKLLFVTFVNKGHVGSFFFSRNIIPLVLVFVNGLLYIGIYNDMTKYITK